MTGENEEIYRYVRNDGVERLRFLTLHPNDCLKRQNYRSNKKKGDFSPLLLWNLLIKSAVYRGIKDENPELVSGLKVYQDQRRGDLK